MATFFSLFLGVLILSSNVPGQKATGENKLGSGQTLLTFFCVLISTFMLFVSSFRHPRARMHFSQVCVGARGKVSVGTPCCVARGLFANVCKEQISFKFTRLINVDLVI